MAQISSFKYHVKKIPVNRPEKMCDRAHQLGTHCNSHSSPRKNDAECDRIREIERDKRTDSERESSPIKIQSFRSRFPFYIVCMPRELLQWMQIITPFLGFSMNEYLPCPGQNWKMQIMANELCVSFVLSISWPLSLFPCLSLSLSLSLARSSTLLISKTISVQFVSIYSNSLLCEMAAQLATTLPWCEQQLPAHSISQCVALMELL